MIPTRQQSLAAPRPRGLVRIYRRRTLGWTLSLLVASYTLWTCGASAGEPGRKGAAKPPPQDLPCLPISVAVAEEDGAPVVSARWLDQQLAETTRLMAPHGVRLQRVRQRPLASRFASLESPEERDGLAPQIQPRVINVFVVRRLKDIDRPNRWIMGVRWRVRSNLAKDYVILSAKALPTTLAHELGHYLGNPHSYVDNNIMSYRRSDPRAVRFDASQGARMRQVVRKHLRTGRLATAAAIIEADRKASKRPEATGQTTPTVAKPAKKP